MRRLDFAALAAAALIASATAVSAQTPAPPLPPPRAAPAPAPAEAAPAARAPRAKPGAMPPPASITIVNASGFTATNIVVSGEGKTATSSKPLKPKEKTAIKLPRLTTCEVSVAATFDSEGQVEVGEFDVCKDRTIRFTQ